MNIESYFREWIKVINKKEFELVLSRVGNEYKKVPICPAQNEVFKAFQLCPYKSLKVVMLGQDPYPQRGVATGILFGNRKEVSEENLSPSLQVIKEAAINYEIPHYGIAFDNTLESWAKQGILMLNTSLTVEMNKVGSHVMIWRPFISSLLSNLSKRESGIIYVLFGKQAQTFIPYINPYLNIILKEYHPSYYARLGIKMPSSIFKLVSESTKLKYGEAITWYTNY